MRCGVTRQARGRVALLPVAPIVAESRKWLSFGDGCGSNAATNFLIFVWCIMFPETCLATP